MDLNAVPVAKRSLEAYNKSQSALNDFNKAFEEWGHNCNVCQNYIAQFRNHLVVHKDGSNGHNTRLPNVITTSTIERTRDLDTLRETRKVPRRRGHQCVLCDKFIYQIHVHMSPHFDGSTSNDESEPQSPQEILVPQNCSETNDVANDELKASSSGNSSTLIPALPNDNDELSCAGENIIFNGDLEPAPPCAPEHVVVTDRTDETRNTDDVPSIASTTSTSVLGDLDPGESSTTEVFQRQSKDDDVENCDETLQPHPNTASLRELSLIPTMSNENHQSHDHSYCAREKPILNGDLPPAPAPAAAYMVVTDRSDRTDETRTTDVSAPGDLDPGEFSTTEVSQRLESNDHDIESCEETLQPDPKLDTLRASSLILTPANDNHQLHDHTYCAREKLILNGDLEPVSPDTHLVVTYRDDRTDETNRTHVSALVELDPRESCRTGISQKLEPHDVNIGNHDEKPQRDASFDTRKEKESSLIPTLGNDNHQPHVQMNWAGENLTLDADLESVAHVGAEPVVVTDGWNETKSTDVPISGLRDLDPGESSTTEVSRRLESNDDDDDIGNCDEKPECDPNIETLMRESSLIVTLANDNHQSHVDANCAGENLTLNGNLKPAPSATRMVVTDRTDETESTDVTAAFTVSTPGLGDPDLGESSTTAVSQRLESSNDDVENCECDETLQADPNTDNLTELSLIPTISNDNHQPHVDTNCAGENLTLNGDSERAPRGAGAEVVIIDGTDETRSTDVSIGCTLSTSTSGFGHLNPDESLSTEVSQNLEPHDDDIEKCGETLQPDPNADTLRESLPLEPEQDVIDIEKSPKGVKRKKSFSQATKQTRKLCELNVPKKQTPERHFVDLGRNSQSSNVLKLHKSKGIRGKSTNCGATTRFMSEKFDHGYLHASKLAGHRQTHTTRALHICDTCGNCFTMRSTLTRHKLSHAGQCPTNPVALHTDEEDLTQETLDKNVEIADDTRNDLNVDIGNGNVNSGLQLSTKNSIGIVSENGRIEKVEKGGSPQGHDHPNSSGENLNLWEDLATTPTDVDGPVTRAINTRYQITEVEIGIEYEMSVEKRQPLTQPTTKTGKQKQLISPKRQPSKRRNLGDNLQSSQDLRLRKSTLTENKSSGVSTRSPRRSGRKRSRPVDPPHHIVSDSEESSDEYLIVSAKKRKILSQVSAKVAEQKELEIPNQRPSKRGARDRGEISQSSRDLRRKSKQTKRKLPNVDASPRPCRKSSRLSQQDGKKAGNYEDSGMSCSDLSSSESEMEESISRKMKKAGKSRMDRKPTLSKHKTTQKKEGRLECEICGSRFHYPFYLTRHMLTHTKEKPHKCTKCGKCFAQRYTLIQHELTHTGEKKYECVTCGRCFALRNGLIQHELTHTREKKYECDVCGRRFTQAGTLTQHKRTHTGGRPKPFTCDICGHGCSSSAELRNHKKVHTGEKSYLCGVCDKSFTFASGLTKHKLVHSKRKDFNCDQCDKRFGQRQHLNQHKLTHTGEKPHKCVVCDKSFTQLSTLSQHKLTHTGQRAHKCDVCKKDFTEKGSLVRHMSIHTGTVKKPFKCDQCEISFAHRNALAKHKLTHTGVKPHKCGMCDKYFALKTTLDRHVLTHTGEKPYRCDVCKRDFAGQSDLARHKLTHTGVKSYKCDICQMCFKLKNTLTQHKKMIHTAENMYKCDLCEDSFRRLHFLNIHKIKHREKK